jgi:hypothetical protein
MRIKINPSTRDLNKGLKKIMKKNKKNVERRITSGIRSGGDKHRLRATKNTSRAVRPLWCFLSATIWAGVNASHCPIACPNRRIPRTLCDILS